MSPTSMSTVAIILGLDQLHERIFVLTTAYKTTTVSAYIITTLCMCDHK